MELPFYLKRLYRHWSFHTAKMKGNLAPKQVFTNSQLFNEIEKFVNERMSIWKKKVLNENPPYTTDPILRTYRFCNIFREFDRQTIVFHTLLNPLRDNFPLWLLNMFYCRMVARYETIETIGILSFNAKKNKMLYKRFKKLSSPRFGTPYVFPVSVILKSDTPTRELFITQYLPSIMRDVAKEISTWRKKSVYDGVQKVIAIFGYNLRFLWTEVLIDVAYQFPHHIDLFAKFPIGPGSAPTIQKINPTEDPAVVVTKLVAISFNTGITYNGRKLRLSAENWEGIGCEFRKYTNLRRGKGRRRLFQQTTISDRKHLN